MHRSRRVAVLCQNDNLRRRQTSVDALVALCLALLASVQRPTQDQAQRALQSLNVGASVRARISSSGLTCDQIRARLRAAGCQVPAGITGYWHRSAADVNQQQASDAYYIYNWSLWLDLWILFRTVGVVLGGKGAH